MKKEKELCLLRVLCCELVWLVMGIEPLTLKAGLGIELPNHKPRLVLFLCHH